MAVISRADAEGLLNTQDINEILQEAPKSSVALSTFRTIRMASTQAKMPVLSALPTAGFVTDSDTSADSNKKPTSNVAWDNKFLNVEEIAVIVPIHENVFDDSSFDIWAEVRPLIAQEFGRVLDGAVFFGTNKPSTWDDSIEDGARTAGNVVNPGSLDLAEDVNQTMALVEADGFDVNQFYAARSLRSQLRGLRNSEGDPIYLDGFRSDNNTATIYGEPVAYVTNGAWVPSDAGSTAGSEPASGADLIAGDRTKAIIGIRQDMTFKLLDQATVGTYNLAERDMIALRCKMRVAFAVANPLQIGVTGGYPFAILAAAQGA